MTKSQLSAALKICGVYQRVSDEGQDLTRQKAIVADAKAAGYYVAGVYSEKASGARSDRPELLRMISDLQPGEVVIAERMGPHFFPVLIDIFKALASRSLCSATS